MFKNEIEIHEPIIFVFLELWEPIISYNFLLWQALHGSETSSPIIKPIITPLRTHNFSRWEPIISYNFLLWQALHGSETSSPIIKPIITPLRTHNFFTLGTHKNSSNFYGDVTLVLFCAKSLYCTEKKQDVQRIESLLLICIVTTSWKQMRKSEVTTVESIKQTDLTSCQETSNE
jgi:hypothetical protein